VLDILKAECLGADQAENTSGCADNNVGAVLLEHLLVLLNWHTAKEDGDLHAVHVLAESLVLFRDLEGQLASVAHNDDGNVAIDRLELLECSEDEDGGLTHTGLGLAEHVHAQNCLRDAFVLDLGRMFETAIDDGSEELRLEKEISKAGRVDGNVTWSFSVLLLLVDGCDWGLLGLLLVVV